MEDHLKHKILASADIFVLPSLHEGFGIVNQEAMFFGLPIITTEIGGQMDFLKNEKNALLLPPANPSALKTAIERMLADDQLRKRMGKNNREEVKLRTFDTTVDKYEQLFEKVIAKRKS